MFWAQVVGPLHEVDPQEAGSDRLPLQRGDSDWRGATCLTAGSLRSLREGRNLNPCGGVRG